MGFLVKVSDNMRASPALMMASVHILCNAFSIVDKVIGNNVPFSTLTTL